MVYAGHKKTLTTISFSALSRFKYGMVCLTCCISELIGIGPTSGSVSISGLRSTRNTRLCPSLPFGAYGGQEIPVYSSRYCQIPGGPAIKIAAYYKEFRTQVQKPPSNQCPRDLWEVYPVGFFDGASSCRTCGSGMAIHLESELFYHFYWYSGKGSNTRVKLHALWGVLFCTKWLHLADIEWENKRHTREDSWTLQLEANDQGVNQGFRRISIPHIFRVQNCEDDKFPKEGCNA